MLDYYNLKCTSRTFRYQWDITLPSWSVWFLLANQASQRMWSPYHTMRKIGPCARNPQTAQVQHCSSPWRSMTSQQKSQNSWRLWLSTLLTLCDQSGSRTKLNWQDPWNYYHDGLTIDSFDSLAGLAQPDALHSLPCHIKPLISRHIITNHRL